MGRRVITLLNQLITLLLRLLTEEVEKKSNITLLNQLITLPLRLLTEEVGKKSNITLLNQLITLLLRLLTEEVGKKSNAITLLDQEKGALIRELFQVNMQSGRMV